MQDAADFARLAADPARLAILGQLALGARTAREVAAAVGGSERDAVRHLGRLCAGGLVRSAAGVFELDQAALRALAATLTDIEPADRSLLVGLDREEAAVVSRYLRGRRLVDIPPAGPRRRAVLAVILDEFLPARYYSEDEVREILTGFHADHAALRRYLVEEGMLARHDGSRTYWRGGGPPPGTGQGP